MAKQVEVTRQFNAPVEMVWRVWTDPELIKRWWGPKQFSSPVARVDFREGGKSIVSMQAPPEMGGQEFYSLWEYKKIVLHKTIEFVQNLCDPNGNRIKPVSVGMPADFPLDVLTVVTFTAVNKASTEMIVTEYAEFGSMSHFAQLGLEQSIGKMAAIFA